MIQSRAWPRDAIPSILSEVVLLQMGKHENCSVNCKLKISLFSSYFCVSQAKIIFGALPYWLGGSWSQKVGILSAGAYFLITHQMAHSILLASLHPLWNHHYFFHLPPNPCYCLCILICMISGLFLWLFNDNGFEWL